MAADPPTPGAAITGAILWVLMWARHASCGPSRVVITQAVGHGGTSR